MADANKEAPSSALTEGMRRAVFRMERDACLLAEAQAAFYRNRRWSAALAAKWSPPRQALVEALWRASPEYADLVRRRDDPTDQPCATGDKLSFRYKSPNGWLLLGAADADEALGMVRDRTAASGITDPTYTQFVALLYVRPENLEQWDWTVKAYVPCTVPKPQPKE